MEWLLEFLRREKSTLQAAPLTFLGAVALGGLAGWYGTSVWYDRELRVMQWTVDAAVQRAGHYPPYTNYSKLTNAELKQRSLEVIQMLEDFHFVWGQQLFDYGNPKGRVNESPEERQKRYTEADQRLKIQWDTEYRSVCENLLKEMMRRVPQEHWPEQPPWGLIAMKGPTLIGAQPVQDVATYLASFTDLLAVE